MSTADTKTKAKTAPVKKTKISFWAELKTQQLGMMILIIAGIIACGFIYVLMNMSPEKMTLVEDGADIYTPAEEENLRKIADELSAEKDINVIIVTTRDKGPDYGQSREERSRFAEDFYKDHAIKTSLVNNSGICYLIDLSTDEPGKRFMWLFTFGTSYYAMDDEEVQDLFVRHTEEFKSENYYDATVKYFDDLKGYEYENLAYIVFFTLIIPALVAWLITRHQSGGKKLDPVPIGKTYLKAQKSIEKTDEMIKQTKKYDPPSSSGSGGSSYSGSSSSSGGFSGGGGHSGGGGGFF